MQHIGQSDGGGGYRQSRPELLGAGQPAEVRVAVAAADQLGVRVVVRVRPAGEEPARLATRPAASCSSIASTNSPTGTSVLSR